MNVDIDWDRVIDVDMHIEEDDFIYTICFVFDDGCVMTYGYSDYKKFIRDCTKVADRRKQ